MMGNSALVPPRELPSRQQSPDLTLQDTNYRTNGGPPNGPNAILD